MTLKTSPLKTISNQNGNMGQASGASRHPIYNTWKQSWNGNRLPPPPADCVLYLPGYPGQGSVIKDYSYNFNDSGIDTDEALDLTETGIDCDADATTAIPVGSIIYLDDGTGEQMLVTATGTTLTVKRAWNNIVATHSTNKDIYVWIPNDGTITGATWVRNSSGLWGLNYDGTDDIVICSDSANLQLADTLEVEFWWEVARITNYEAIISKSASVGTTGWEVMYRGGDDPKRFWFIINNKNVFAEVVLTVGNSYHIRATLSSGAGKIYLNDTDITTSSDSGISITDDGDPLRIGKDHFGWWTKGIIYIPKLNSSISGGNFEQERHLFGV